MSGDDPLAAIEFELERIGATPTSVGVRDSIGVNDEQDGWASLGASELRHDFYWYGQTDVILERLRELPNGGGPVSIRLAFRTEMLEF